MSEAAKKMIGARIGVDVIADLHRLARVRNQSIAVTLEHAIVDAVEGMDDPERAVFDAITQHDEQKAVDLADSIAKLNSISRAMLEQYGEDA